VRYINELFPIVPHSAYEQLSN